MSTPPVAESRPADSIAGFLAALSIFAGLIGLVYHPVRLIPFAILLALIATAMGGNHARLAQLALITGGICFICGLAIAVITNNPVF